MKGIGTFPKHGVECQVKDTRPRGNQVAIKQPLGETASSPSMILVISSLFEAVNSKYFLSYLMGDAKKKKRERD